MMKKMLGAGLVAAAIAASATTASANEFKWSFNIGATTDYVFRGISQTAENPTVQGGVDVSYGIFYAGVWASGVDFGDTTAVGFPTRNVATLEADFYAGVKPTLGPVTFDLGVIYYAYPGARDNFATTNVREQDYVEIKGGASGAVIPFLPKLTLGGVVYFSPDYTGEQGETWTTEATAAYELPALWKFTPTVSGLVGAVYGEFDANAAGRNPGFVAANGEDSYLYWNVGLTLAIEKLSFDFRYWDTDIKNAGVSSQTLCTNPTFQCDERFVFTAKFTY
jgi:uncharacterized protein (TIGR02001 family)